MPDNILIRGDIPVPKIKVDKMYEDTIEILQVNESFEIPEGDRVRVIQFVKRKYGVTRIFTTNTHEGKLYLQRQK